MKPAVNQYFVNSNNINDTEITLSGDNAYIFHNITGKCGENDTDCEMGLSLSMWMKQEPLDYVENVESAPTSGNIRRSTLNIILIDGNRHFAKYYRCEFRMTATYLI